MINSFLKILTSIQIVEEKKQSVLNFKGTFLYVSKILSKIIQLNGKNHT